ncbi:hypothetical protein LQZ19_07870 [Treponema primitia]|uniref:hypothetical protein n=1 Tax=Treponema primitia TaxID=88058 RepID=UPI00397F78E4
MRYPYFLILICFLSLPGFIYPQSSETVPTENSGEPVPLSRSFRHIFLGIDLEALKTALRADNIFYFREDRDVSLMPSDREQTLVETQGFSFIRRAFFQLRYGEVFVMSFTLNTTLVDHYSVFSSLRQRYGEPSSLNPQEAVWENDDTRISIERPLTVKYIDKYNFDMLKLSPAEILVGPSADGARELLNRNEFLEGF